MTMHDILEHFSAISRTVSGMRTNWFRPQMNYGDGTAELIYRFRPYNKMEGKDVYLSLYIRSGDDVSMDDRFRPVMGYDDLSIGLTKVFEKEAKKEILFPRITVIPNYQIPLILPFLGGMWEDMMTDEKESNRKNFAVIVELFGDIMQYIVKSW